MATLNHQHYDTNFDINPYYVPITNQLSPMYDKSKKTWSQRLKITKSEKTTAQMVVPQQLPPPQMQPQQLQLNEFTGGIEFSQSALSRSMKYAEPWIYGTVRGIPARPMHFLPGQAMFAPSEIAVVICSCPEYLNGTKREVKKASVCKKCKGSRLPLAPIGGTVRIRPTSTPIQQKLRPTNASTLRVVSSKSRPSILEQQRDPYDLMRRSRLLSPEPKSSSHQQEKKIRSIRGKSSSPNRSRSRTPRSQLEEVAKSSPKQGSTSSSGKTDRWIIDDDNEFTVDNKHRRSILRCNVNPYDLISNKSTTSSSSSGQHLSKFSPNHPDEDDEDVVPDIFGVTTTKTINQKTTINRKTTGPGTISSPSPSPSTASSSCNTGSSSSSTSYTAGPHTSKTMNYANVKAIAGQRISFGENSTSPSLITQNGESFMYENVAPVSLDNETNTSNSPKIQKQQNNAKKEAENIPATTQVATNQPQRPPRRKNDVISTQGNEDDGAGSVNQTNQQHHQMSSQISTDLGGTAASQRLSIKSILKRPPSSPSSTTISAVSTPSKSSLNSDTDTGNLTASTTDSCRFDQQQQQQQRQHNHHQIKRNSARTHESSVKNVSAGSTNDCCSSGSSCSDTIVAKSNTGQKTIVETKTGSQFYIPLPQARKKVQFMVEDKIIQVDNASYGDDDDHQDDDYDEDDYHSAQGDEDDKNDIPKQIGKTHTQNYRKCNTSVVECGGVENCKIDTRESSTEPFPNAGLHHDNVTIDSNEDYSENASHVELKTNPKDSSPNATSNRFNEELMQRQQQQKLLKKTQETVLNLLHHESNLVSSELLNSGKSSYNQNMLHHQNNSTSQDQDEPHYEDVADDDENDENEKDIDSVDEQTMLAKGEIDPCGRLNGTRPKDTASGNLMTSTKPSPEEGMTTPSPPSPPVVSRKAIRRTHSERHLCNVNIGTSSNNVVLNFKDTMALRIKATRKDSRDLFSNSSSTIQQQQSVGLFRPKEPPPPPPTGGGTSVSVHQQQRLLSNTHTNVLAKETLSPRVAAGGNNKTPTILITTAATKDDADKKTNFHGSGVDDDVEKSVCNQELPSRNHKLSVNSIGLEDQKPPPFIRHDANQRIRFSDNVVDDSSRNSCQDRTTTNIYETFDSFSPVKVAATTTISLSPTPKHIFGSTNQPNRTVVRVAPFNKSTSEIHRLKITHTDDDSKLVEGNRNSTNTINTQKKTSILINGDDCYSTVNVTNDTPLYQSSVVVADSSSIDPMLKVTSNTVTINVVSSSPRTPQEELIYKNNKINTLLSRGAKKAIIPIGGSGSGCGSSSSATVNSPDSVKTSSKQGRTLITFDYDKTPTPICATQKDVQLVSPGSDFESNDDVFSHEEELVKILRNPVEAVRRNLVPHICGKASESTSSLDQSKSSENDNKSSKRQRKRHKSNELTIPSSSMCRSERNSFVGKLLEDPTLSHLADGLENEVVVKLIENSLIRLKESRNSLDTSGTKDNDDMNRLINISLQKIKEDRQKLDTSETDEQHEIQSNRGSISSGNSFSSANYEMFDFSDNNESDCYQSCSSEIAADVENPLATRSKFYQMLVDATLAEIEISTNAEDDHHYESIRGNNGDPIYEEITDIPPPLPLSPPPLNDPELEKKAARSMFEGASKYDILSYLVDAKERGLVREESFEYNINNTSNPIIIEEENDTLSDLKQISEMSSRISHLSVTSDSSEDNNSLLGSTINDRLSAISALRKGTSSEIERNDSGVGSETSKSSRSKYQNNPQAGSVLSKISPIHLCEDCDGPVETQLTDSGVMFAPLVCRKCGKKRAERKEIITEIVETEEKYGRDLSIILEEFCQPMLVAGLLTQEQLSAIFLNTEELLENNQTLAERMRDALDIALEQGDDDLLTVNIGRVFLDFTQMLHAFESYCVRQAGASLLLANLEKEKELLRIFLKVSQMENTVLRRMNLNSFLMVPVQRVTKYPLLLARLYKVTPPHLEGRDLLKQAQEKIELHLNHINQEAKDVPTKLWRRISASSPNRRASCEIDMINIKLRKLAIDILEWNHDEVRFAMEGKLMYTQPTDSNWKKGRTIKLNPINALLVTNGKPSVNYKAEKATAGQLNFPKHTGIREASLLVIKEKCGRYTLIREPLYLDRCVVCSEAEWDDYFELQEISSKDTFIFKAEDGVRTKQWYTQLQYHAQGMGAWRKRRNALANIMINGMLSRT